MSLQALAANAASLIGQITANANYYVRSDGSDINDGLSNSSAGAFLTIQAAIDHAASFGGSIFNVTINVADGTYTSPVILKSYIGSGTWSIIGNVTTPSNVVISTTSAGAISATNILGAWTVKGMKVQTTTAGHGVSVLGTNTNVLLDNFEFGAMAAGYSHMLSQEGADVQLGPTYAISGGAFDHLFASNQGMINAAGSAVTITNTPVLTNWLRAQRGAGLQYSGVTTAGAISAGCKKYVATMNAWIETGAGTIPGTVAGTTATGGQFE